MTISEPSTNGDGRSRFAELLRTRSLYHPWDIVLMVAGGLAVIFGIFSLGMVGVQKSMLGVMPTPDEEPGMDGFVRVMDAIHNLWLIHMPLMSLGGAIMIIGAWWLHLNWERGRWLSLGACVYVIVWGISYAIAGMRVSEVFMTALSDFNSVAPPLFVPFASVLAKLGGPMTIGMIVVPTLVVMWALRKPRGHVIAKGT